MRVADLAVVAVAGGRTLLGAVAIVHPELMARPWLGRVAADRDSVRVLGRALGGRDVALGAGVLWSRWHGEPARSTAAWVLGGALADAIDALATLASSDSLPAGTPARIAVLAGGSALVGATAAPRLAPRG